MMKIKDYDLYVVAFSGGKDSIACFLTLLEQGVPVHKIELWHHLIDGSPEEKPFMDWTITESYCKKFAEAFGVPIYFSWKEGGFKREMLRENSLTAPTWFETPNDGLKSIGGTRGKKSTRQKFPQISADLKVRWCSAYLKIDICSAAIRNQTRFNNLKTVVISGERGEESSARAKYKELEPDRSDSRNGKLNRLVDRARIIKNLKEFEVWALIEKYKVVVHPSYYLGFSRCSCQFCIFGNADQFLTASFLSPERFGEMMDYEVDFGVTLKRDKNLLELISKGTIYPASKKVKSVEIANSKEYTGDIFTDKWKLPSGAFGDSCGPT